MNTQSGRLNLDHLTVLGARGYNGMNPLSFPVTG
jgi:hypothetical protein